MTRFFGRALVLLTAGTFAAACSDGPTATVEAPEAAVMQPATAANGQSAALGEAVAVAPAVVVRDGRGTPLSGQSVVFTVTRGGGSVASVNARTDATGTASAGEWRLGTTPGVNEVMATVAGLEPVKFTATSVGPVEETSSGVASAFDIDVRYIGTASVRQREAVAKAVARWRSVITADLTDIPVNAQAGACFAAQPALNERVDDLLVFVQFDSIDGVGRILGEAGPCLIRNDSKLPVVGQLRLDRADLEKMEQNGTLDDVVLHEIGHILGIGTLWDYKGLLTGKGGADPQFTGKGALGAYLAMGVTTASGVPAENTGGEGTRDGHWRESVFGNELMTGFIGGATNPLSALTIESLRDLGYGTTLASAASFTLGTSRVTSTAGLLNLAAAERVHRPKFEVDRSGRTDRISVSHMH